MIYPHCWYHNNLQELNLIITYILTRAFILSQYNMIFNPEIICFLIFYLYIIEFSLTELCLGISPFRLSMVRSLRLYFSGLIERNKTAVFFLVIGCAICSIKKNSRANPEQIQHFVRFLRFSEINAGDVAQMVEIVKLQQLHLYQTS